MKNRPFHQRLFYALSGLRCAWREHSFRTQVVLGLGAIAVLLYFRPAPIWWAVFALVIAAVLAAEMFNTALEHVVDRLHPETHPVIAKAKDCAAGAVLLLSLGALAILAAFLFEQWQS